MNIWILAWLSVGDPTWLPCLWNSCRRLEAHPLIFLGSWLCDGPQVACSILFLCFVQKANQIYVLNYDRQFFLECYVLSKLLIYICYVFFSFLKNFVPNLPFFLMKFSCQGKCAEIQKKENWIFSKRILLKFRVQEKQLLDQKIQNERCFDSP